VANRSRNHFDVVILGGGLAGLTLAIQLKRRRDATKIAVVEKRAWPVPEAAHKVGESTLQIGAHYFREVCGMGESLEGEQLRKMGLRFFLAGDGDDLSSRIEMGLAEWADDAPTYQLDRGRFENALAVEAERLGVDLRPGLSVAGIERVDNEHVVSVRGAGEAEAAELRGTWVVDASGRAAILKRKFGLGVEVPHSCNAAWFRIGSRIDIDDWSKDRAWRDRVPSATRWQSTNHLMGPGYWFWVIPLASGSTSFGLVADPDLVPFEQMRRFDPLMDWLHRNEPVAAACLEQHREELQDFRLLKHYSHGCEQVFSKDRWCITGEAGVFLDPLYSPGSDMIAISNTMITRFVTASLEGKDVDQGVEFFNDLYLLIGSRLLSSWSHQYPIFANPEVTAAKVTWDFMTYFGALALLAVTGNVAEARFLVTVLRDVDRIGELNLNMQRHLRRWSELSNGGDGSGIVCISEEGYRRLESDVATVREPERVREVVSRNTARIEAAAIEIMARSAAALGIEVNPSELDPYTFHLPGADEEEEEDDCWRPPAPTIRSLQEVSEPFTPLRDPELGSDLVWATLAKPDSAVGSAYSVWLPDSKPGGKGDVV
jgi:flavin-dependent dehydrogenase